MNEAVSYQQLANEYDDKICKNSRWAWMWDKNLPTDKQMEEYLSRSDLSQAEVFELFEEWFEGKTSWKDESNEYAETFREQFDRWFE